MSSYARKETVDIGIFVTSRNSDRKIMQLLACLNFTLDTEYSAGTGKRSDFYEYGRNYDVIFIKDIYINSNLEPITKFSSSCRSTMFKDTLPWNTSQLPLTSISISTRIVIGCVMKRGIPF